MYICHCCGETFQEPESKTWKEKLYMFDFMDEIPCGVEICPFCGAEEPQEIDEDEDDEEEYDDEEE